MDVNKRVDGAVGSASFSRSGADARDETKKKRRISRVEPRVHRLRNGPGGWI